jgi:hypothetical protein
MEIWKDISGKEGEYSVSNYGRVKSHDRIVNAGRRGQRHRNEMILKPSISKRGYCRVALEKGKASLVHRLVAQHFIPNPENKPEINHKDGVKNNNHIDNLEWCTRFENEQHAWKTGRKKALKGEKHPSSKTSDAVRKQIAELYLAGKRICEIAEIVNLHQDYVFKLVKKSGIYEKRQRQKLFVGEVVREYQRNYQREWVKTHPGRAQKYIPLELQERKNGRFVCIKSEGSAIETALDKIPTTIMRKAN